MGSNLYTHHSLTQFQRREIPHYASFVGSIRNDRIMDVNSWEEAAGRRIEVSMEGEFYTGSPPLLPRLPPEACHSERSEESPSTIC
jgi:hypothetical protein